MRTFLDKLFGSQIIVPVAILLLLNFLGRRGPGWPVPGYG